VEDENTDFHNIFNGWQNEFCQLLNVHGFNDVRQTEVHTAEPLIPKPNSCEDGKRYKWPDVDHILAELIQARGKALCC
jgi:hypothetical protein